jgi:hypothetical protein
MLETFLMPHGPLLFVRTRPLNRLYQRVVTPRVDGIAAAVTDDAASRLHGLSGSTVIPHEPASITMTGTRVILMTGEWIHGEPAWFFFPGPTIDASVSI